MKLLKLSENNKMNREQVKAVYFVGAGGIGMSALIRWFLSQGIKVAGYDRTPSELTEALKKEGADIHYTIDVNLIPEAFKNPEDTLVVYTAAIPTDQAELAYFMAHGFEVMKRAQVLGIITNPMRSLCVSGTHGKTTTSSMLAHLLKNSHVDCNAFLGGIVRNYESNLMLSDKSDFAVLEADEFDRSFHWLRPYMAVVTAADPDHLDIYGTPEAYRESFEKFTSLIRPGGCLLIKKGINVTPHLQEGVKMYTYTGSAEGDFHAENIRIGKGEIFFDFVGPNIRISDLQLGVPVPVNVENGVAAVAMAWLNGATPDEIRKAMPTFAGAHRRFEFHLKTDKLVLIDDYAHHPAELKACIESVRELYKDKKLTGIFQPHLYTRTRDFAADFAKSLSLLDELILLDIYPAREQPIPGVTSKIIYDQMTIKDKKMCTKAELPALIESGHYEVVLMVGAGDIDRLVEPVKEILAKKL